MRDTPIGIIDSGSGGLSIWEHITSLLPHEATVYIGDHGNVPYSSKTEGFIRNHVPILIEFLLAHNAKLVVIACNTATVAGINHYRGLYPDLPIVGVVPVVKTAAERSIKKCFAVLSTPFTANSQYQKDLIKKFADRCTVHSVGCPNVVSLIEMGEASSKRLKKELRELLQPFVQRIDVLALGCTHFPFLRPVIRDIVGEEVQILDSGGAVARQVKRILEHNRSLGAASKPRHMFFTTGNAGHVTKIATALLKKAVQFTYAAV